MQWVKLHYGLIHLYDVSHNSLERVELQSGSYGICIDLLTSIPKDRIPSLRCSMTQQRVRERNTSFVILAYLYIMILRERKMRFKGFNSSYRLCHRRHE
jgi:hypothetical protein